LKEDTKFKINILSLKIMPSDRVQKKITNYMEILGGENAKKCVGYVENTLDYAEISTVIKTDNKVRTTVKRKTLQSLTHSAF